MREFNAHFPKGIDRGSQAVVVPTRPDGWSVVTSISEKFKGGFVAGANRRTIIAYSRYTPKELSQTKTS